MSPCFTTVSSPEQRHYPTQTTLKILVAMLNTQIAKTLVAKCVCETMDSVSAAQWALVLKAFACFPLDSSPYFGRTDCGEVRYLTLYFLAIELLELI